MGPRSSFVLWEQAVAVVGEAIDRGIPAEQVSLVFAGGIHDARSAALVAALAGPLAARGVKVGVLVGTAYLFTQEAVTTGAIVPRFQDEVLRCEETVLLESGPGHQVRVSPTPFVARFEEERKRLRGRGAIGRGNPRGPGGPERRPAPSRHQGDRPRPGGRLPARRRSATNTRRPTASTCWGRSPLCATGRRPSPSSTTSSVPASTELSWSAICTRIGTSNGVRDVRRGRRTSPSSAWRRSSRARPSVARFWSNTLRGFDAITEIPPDRWDWRLYYDPDPKAPDKIVSKWGGFLPDVAFDPLRYGMPPSSLPSIEPAQLLALEVVRTALADAGYAERPFPREQTAVVLGMGGGAAQLAMGFAFRSYLPMLDTVLPAGGKQAIESCQGLLPEWTEDSFPGFPAQRHGGPDRQPLEPGRVELHGRRRLRLVAGRGRAGRARARDRRGRHGDPGRRRHGPEPVHLPGLQQDPGVLAAGPLPAVRRRRRRHRHQRGRGRAGAQAPGRRRARRRPDLRGDQGRGRLERRPRPRA